MYGLLVFGDSITLGFGDPDQGWCGRLKKRFESLDEYHFCFNLGICGDTTTNLLARIDTEAKARARYSREDDRHAIIIAIGINDSRLNGTTPETEPGTYDANLREILSIAKRHADRVLFIGPTPVDETLTEDYEGTTFTNERVRTYADIARSVCGEHAVPFLDVFENLVHEPYEHLFIDGLHPNAAGYERMHVLIEAFLDEHDI